MESSYVYHHQDGVRRRAIVETENPYKLVVQTQIDMTGTVDNIQRYRDLQGTDPVSRKSAWKWVARIPMTVYEQSVHEEWDDRDWAKWLNDPDNAAFRVWRGRV